MKLSASITIDQPKQAVFDFVADVENMPRWVSGVSAARLISPEMAMGARFEAQYRPAWRSDRIEFEVVSYDPPNSFCTRTRRGPFQFEGCVSLADAGGGTTVTNTIEAGPDSLSTRLATMLFGPFLRRSMRRRLAGELTALEHAVTH
jgi:carbon monoxide dehydrogenase subunit G